MENVLTKGCKIIICSPGEWIDREGIRETLYESRLVNKYTDESLDILVPENHGAHMQIHKGERYDCYFFLESRIMSCSVQVEGMIEWHKLELVHIRRVNQLLKYERRGFKRISCETAIRYLLITHDNSREFREAADQKRLMTMEGFKDGTTLDISGGGVKFVSEEQLPHDSLVVVDFSTNGQKYVFLAKVIASIEIDKERGEYEQRLKYIEMEGKERNRILSFLYEREREKRNISTQTKK